MKKLEFNTRELKLIQKAIVCYKIIDSEKLSTDDNIELQDLYIKTSPTL